MGTARKKAATKGQKGKNPYATIYSQQHNSLQMVERREFYSTEHLAHIFYSLVVVSSHVVVKLLILTK